MKSPASRLVAALLFSASIVVAASAAQPISTAPVEGLRDASSRVHALIGARVIPAPGNVIENGTVVIRDGVIEAVGAGLAAPADARVWDVRGRTIYAGFIESETSLFLPPGWRSGSANLRESEGDAILPGRSTATPAAPAAAETAGGARAWNQRVTPERQASRVLQPDTRGAEALRKLGFAAVHVIPARGIFRGQTALVSLGRGTFNQTIIRDAVAQSFALEHGGSGAAQGYPVSLMGAVAVLRQTLLDAQWYADVQTRYRKPEVSSVARPETNDALAALGPVLRGERPVLFVLEDELDTARAARIAEEFKLKLVLRGSGYDYRTLRSLPKDTSMILPLTFPEAPEVENAEHALDISLDKLEHWELAPGNPARVSSAGAQIAFTTAGLKKPDTEFWPRVRRAVQHGLPAGKALAALTTTPSEIFDVARTHGTIAVGKSASIVVAKGDLFTDEEAEIQLVWIDGEPFELEAWRRFDARGTWRATWEGVGSPPAEIKITGRSATRLKATVAGADATVRVEGESFTMLAPGKWFGLKEGVVRLTAHSETGVLHGTGELPEGTSLRWRAERSAAAAEPSRPAPKKVVTTIAHPEVYPAGAFGRRSAPEQPKHVLVKGATIWTSGPAGIIEHGDLLVEHGKVVRVGQGIAAPTGAVVIDATGKHVSPGLIDCHSHAALTRGINEGSHAVTIEVRVGDAIDPTDIALYWQLAGGLTTSNILHGSANPMGGQNQVIKLRWGETADGLKFAGAPPGVKFALGENVTRKNATTPSTRYPVSRMGVREIMLDTFTRARDYEREWEAFRGGRAALPPRRDLRLEAALEMLRGERLIHIHSYRQDEVLAFIRLAQQLKLPVATFQHILEGYKVAKEIASIGAGGSCFSDWWAYKHEVVDAIPYAGALMREAGVVVSFNSDDKELARHLNTEAAKAVKYGGVPPPEALKFVTLNPAKQLRIDDRVGSLEAGKDADFVIWSAPPLSSYARPLQTWIDGRRYFDVDEDAEMRLAAAAARVALVQKIIPERQKALGSGAGGPDGANTSDTSDKPAALLLLEHLATSHSSGVQPLYHDGGNDHNCSTHDFQ